MIPAKITTTRSTAAARLSIPHLAGAALLAALVAGSATDAAQAFSPPILGEMPAVHRLAVRDGDGSGLDGPFARGPVPTPPGGFGGLPIPGPPAPPPGPPPGPVDVPPVGDDPPPAGLAAFPGAEGFGATTPGGRAGRVVYVTHLGDSGPGSLREALKTPGPRMILFRVAGLLRLESPLYLGGAPGEPGSGAAESFVTVAGQSAPGGGVTIADYPLILRNGVHDVVIRHLRFRNAQRSLETEPRSTGDGIDLQGASRVVVDHCSFSWATDENFSAERGVNRDITVQYSILAEGLANGGHEAGVHSRGMNLSRGADRFSVHHNLFIANNMRNPHLNGCAGNPACAGQPEWPETPLFDVRHNVVYNWSRRATHLSFGARANVVGNLYVPGPSTPPGSPPILFQDSDQGTQAWVADNESSAQPGAAQEALVGAMFPPVTGLLAAPLAAPRVTPTSPSELVDLVVRSVGALPPDSVDLRLVADLVEGRGVSGAPGRTHDLPVPAPAVGAPYPDTDGDGVEDSWERTMGLDPLDPSDGAEDSDGDGYTHLEEFLETLIP